MTEFSDCLAIGAGPAALTAAIYLARFRRKVTVIDGGDSRATWIPRTRNYPGFPRGISGADLIDNLRLQAVQFGANIGRGKVVQLRRLSDGTFKADLEDTTTISARTVLLATGIVDKLPDILNIREAVARGAVRLCPVCDAFEVRDRRIAILASSEQGVEHALFLRTYTADVTLLMNSFGSLNSQHRARLEQAGVFIVEEAPNDIAVAGSRVVISMVGGVVHSLDVLYPELGCSVRTELVDPMGVRRNEIGELIVDRFQRTSVGGLYAAGDVVNGLNQISVATGQAAIAATHIHSLLQTNFT